MSGPRVINEEEFRQLFGTKLGQYLDGAVTVLNDYGEHLSWDVANLLLHAADQDKVDEVLAILENHWCEHLQYQHPDIRGTVSDGLGVNKTQQLFLNLCTDKLGLTPAS